MTDAELQQLLALDDAPGPALAIDATRADAIVAAALAGAGFGGGGGGDGGGGGASSATGATRPRGGTFATAKLALVGGTAIIVIAIVLLARRGGRGEPEQVVTVIPDAAIDAGGGAVGEPADEPAHEPADEPTDEPPTIDMSDVIPDEPPVARPARRGSATTDAATDLLAAANAKRAAKEWRASDALYTRVVQRAPNSLAAQTALVASASLHLEHLGDPKGAAQRFRRALALAPRGALAEDARWGLAEVARASHDAAGEKAALDDFLAHHATSPLAARAKARRAELR